MNFQNLAKIENSQFFLDNGFKAGQEAAEKFRLRKFKDKMTKSKTIEIERIQAVKRSIIQNLSHILDKFPVVDELTPFYKELVKTTLDYESLKRSLGGVNWARGKVERFTEFYKDKIIRAKEIELINKYRKEFYGRISSIVNQISPELGYIEESRKILRNYPSIKSSTFSVCLFGFPNVGKSTLLAKLTDASPEIKNYAFTTKSINIGYFSLEGKKIQIIDTPGTLDRFDKMNAIEKQAYLVLKYVADLIVFVYDPTEGYPLEDQKTLLERIRTDFKEKSIIVYISKMDIARNKNIPAIIAKKYDTATDNSALVGLIKKYFVDPQRIDVPEERKRKKPRKPGYE